MEPAGLEVILGDYPAAEALKSGGGAAGGARLVFRKGSPTALFRPFLRRLDVPLSELPIMTFLAAREAGAPIALLPAVVMAGSQHRFLFCRSSGKRPSPKDLIGERVAIRSYAVTTATWIRDILQREHGVDPRLVEWVACEPPHVESFVSPSNVVAAPEGATPEGLLREGAAAAAVLRYVSAADPFVPLIPDAESAGAAWIEREGAIQINHMLCVTKRFAAENGAAVAAFLDRLRESSDKSRSSADRFIIGRDKIEASLEKAIDCALRQGVIVRPVRPDELYAGNGLH